MSDMCKSANRHIRVLYARMFKWICSVRHEDGISAKELRTRVKLITMRECLGDQSM